LIFDIPGLFNINTGINIDMRRFT